VRTVKLRRASVGNDAKRNSMTQNNNKYLTRNLSRRKVFSLAGRAAALLSCPHVIIRNSSAAPSWSDGNPFSLGVAAGEPSPDGFVLWTRLAPNPLSQNPNSPGGLTSGDLLVDYEIATDPGLHKIVRRGQTTADKQFAHSVHVEVEGLSPGRPYFYRFMVGEAVSRIGRAVTAPPPDRPLDRLRFGFVSCSNYEHGYFSAYRHLADENPDLVLFLGDYIYESIDHNPNNVRRHSDGIEASTLSTYRNRYSQYRLDPDLQRLHAEVPALITWDDHEVQNDYADQWSETFDEPSTFLRRRAAGYQAFYEHMPLRPSRSRPDGPNMRVYDRFTFGNLAKISMIDGRQYRSREACYGPPKQGGGHLVTDANCIERLDESRSMIGAAQERWLYEGLTTSKARWNIIAQDVLMAQLRQETADGAASYWTDNWNGYPANRRRLIEHIRDSKVSNPIVLSGDIHSFWTNDLKVNFDDERSPTIAVEFVGTSISSRGVPYERFAKFLPDNPHVRFFESRLRGYVSVELTHRHMLTRFQTVTDVHDPSSSISTLRTFIVENGRPGAKPV
jgi:alkaline phosphatase D